MSSSEISINSGLFFPVSVHLARRRKRENRKKHKRFKWATSSMTDIMSTYISPPDVHHMVPLNYKGGWEEWAACVFREEGGRSGNDGFQLIISLSSLYQN